MAVVDYAQHLARRLAEQAGARKVERTRLRLEIATAELLAEWSYGRLTVDDITARAGLAHGTFYRYYAGKHEIVLAVLQDSWARSAACARPCRKWPTRGSPSTRPTATMSRSIARISA